MDNKHYIPAETQWDYWRRRLERNEPLNDIELMGALRSALSMDTDYGPAISTDKLFLLERFNKRLIDG